MYKRLTGLKIRKALELNLSMEEIFQIETSEDGDKAAKEIYEEDVTHSSELENVDEIFPEGTYMINYSSTKEEIQLTTNLKAYVYDFYVASKEEILGHGDFNIVSEKCKEVTFLNTEKLDYFEFLLNLMEAHKFLGKFNRESFKRKFIGIGSFKIEEYAINHMVVELSDLHMLDFYVQDSNLISTINNILSADYEKDIMEQKEYFTDEEYYFLLETVKKHKKILNQSLIDFK